MVSSCAPKRVASLFSRSWWPHMFFGKEINFFICLIQCQISFLSYLFWRKSWDEFQFDTECNDV